MRDEANVGTVVPIRRVLIRIRALRRDRGFSQAMLATKAGLSREYVARLEAGRHDPTITVLTRIAKALKVSVADLVD